MEYPERDITREDYQFFNNSQVPNLDDDLKDLVYAFYINLIHQGGENGQPLTRKQIQDKTNTIIPHYISIHNKRRIQQPPDVAIGIENDEPNEDDNEDEDEELPMPPKPMTVTVTDPKMNKYIIAHVHEGTTVANLKTILQIKYPLSKPPDDKTMTLMYNKRELHDNMFLGDIGYVPNASISILYIKKKSRGGSIKRRRSKRYITMKRSRKHKSRMR
ncbi:MAG: hypothetical protein EBU66_12165 [Bacteroidetes bacterium]|nr:hypothetical protein [bacterium]NBP65398.1 hypothetical protein [Bacteroidota bacterium]